MSVGEDMLAKTKNMGEDEKEVSDIRDQDHARYPLTRKETGTEQRRM